MNTEDFVTYEQAISLANLGFDKYCTHYYCSNRPNYLNEVSPKTFGMYSIDYDFNYTEGTGNIDFDDCVSAPTLAQAQKWLRKEKNLYIYAEPIITNCVDKYFYTICEISNKMQTWSNIDFDSPEEALSAGITECIKLLENE